MNSYICNLNDNLQNEQLKKMKEYAISNNVPIMETDGIANLLLLINLTNAKRILEIGSAIGYSALMMASVSCVERIDTIERDEKMIIEARKNIKESSYYDKVVLHYNDALLIDNNELLQEYDLILIDAAKAQYQKFFEKFTPLLKVGGIVITDNILFHGCVENQENLTKNVLKMAKKIEKYNEYLTNIPNYKTYFLKVGDGQAVSIKKGF